MAVIEQVLRPERMIPVIRFLARRDWTSRAMTRALAPFNPLDPRRYTNPYPLYDELRAHGPVYHHTRAATWLVSGHPECEEVLRGSVSVDRSEMMSTLSPYRDMDRQALDMLTSTLLLVDPPDHTRLRALVSRAFTPRRVAGLEPEVFRIAHQLLDDVEADLARGLANGADVMAPFAVKLPIYMIGRMLGLDEETWPRLKTLSDVVARFVDPLSGFVADDMDRAVGELSDLFETEIERRRTEPRDDLITALVEAEADGDRLDTTELKGMIILLMVAGHETTTGLIGNALLALDAGEDGDVEGGSAGRAARRRMIDEPELIDNAVEELIRYDSPVQGTDRYTTDDLRVDGQTIPAGTGVVMLLGAANRDPRVHDRPNELLLDRADPKPMSFGHGAHYCIGAALARLEAKVAIPAFLERFPDYTVDRSQLEWKRSIVLRGPTRLVVQA